MGFRGHWRGVGRLPTPMIAPMFYPPIKTPLNAFLDPGERLLWAGQPRRGLRLGAQDVFLIPFSLVWCGFSLFWECMALAGASQTPGLFGIIFPLFGLPFVLIGLYLVFGRFFVDAHSRSRTWYGVTADRVIILNGIFSQQTKTIALNQLGDLSLALRKDGSGTLTFGAMRHPMANFPQGGASLPGAAQHMAPSFNHIENAKDVHDLIRNAQKKAANP